MPPETNLTSLLASMKPEIQPGLFVFSTVYSDEFQNLQNKAIGWFREQEGITLILKKEIAITYGIDYIFPSNMITLTVHSSLEAVGFLAVLTEKLAAEGISVNAISAYYHDHLFVPVKHAEQALAILNKIMNDAIDRTNE